MEIIVSILVIGKSTSLVTNIYFPGTPLHRIERIYLCQRRARIMLPG